MKVLLLSNQGMHDGVIGNPIMLRMRDALKEDKRVEEVLMQRCKKPFSVRKELREKAKLADVIHLHFGGTYALVVWFLLIGIKKPKIITFHGTDIHAKAIKSAKSLLVKIRIKLNQISSFACIALYDRCGFVASEMLEYVPALLSRQIKMKSFVQPLGVDYKLFSEVEKEQAWKHLNLTPSKYVLFSDVHNSSIKRRDIAESIVRMLGDEYQLLIVCGVSPNEVPWYVNACDFVLLTSDDEGSPNIVREALSLNKPVFSFDVGDVAKQLEGLNNSTIISRNLEQASSTILDYLKKPYGDNTRLTKKNVVDIAVCTRRIIDMFDELINE